MINLVVSFQRTVVNLAVAVRGWFCRCRSIRAVVGTCPDAVEQGINELGMNVLVVEYPHQDPQTIYAMVERLLRQWPSVEPMVERQLADLHRCQ